MTFGSPAGGQPQGARADPYSLYQLSVSLQSQGFASFPFPTLDQFRAEVAWPRDWPEAQAGEAPVEAPGEAYEAHMDEEMTNLLDFLGGSGAI